MKYGWPLLFVLVVAFVACDKGDIANEFFPHLPDADVHNPAVDRFSDAQENWLFVDPTRNTIVILNSSLHFESPYMTHVDGATTVFDSRVKNRVFYELPVAANRAIVFSEDGIQEYALNENAGQKVLQQIRNKREVGTRIRDFEGKIRENKVGDNGTHGR